MKSKSSEPSNSEVFVFFASIVVGIFFWWKDAWAWYESLFFVLVVSGSFSAICDALRKRASRQQNQASQESKPVESASSPILLPHTFSFEYVSDSGGRERRTVSVEQIKQNGSDTYLEGFCKKRFATRTFRTDRINGQLTDMDTGELLSVSRLLNDVKQRSPMNYNPQGSGSGGTKRDWQTAVYFAGFRGNKYAELESLAIASGWHVRAHISPSVDYFVCNGSAGKKQIAEAEAHGITVIGENEFRMLV